MSYKVSLREEKKEDLQEMRTSALSQNETESAAFNKIKKIQQFFLGGEGGWKLTQGTVTNQ